MYMCVCVYTHSHRDIHAACTVLRGSKLGTRHLESPKIQVESRDIITVYQIHDILKS